MSSSRRESSPASLPITRSLTLVYVSSLAITVIMVAVSVAGLLYPARVYPTDELLQSFLANDVVNLLIGVPILLGSMWLTRRGKLIGLLFWPGALFYVPYNYIAYVFGMPLDVLFLFYLALVGLSVYSTIALVTSIDGEAVRQRLRGLVPERLAGGVLAGLGTLFLLFVIGTVGAALVNQTPIPEAELAVQVADSMIIPAWVIGGVMLWRRKALGYVAGVGLLFQGSMLFVGLIIVLLLQPLLTAAPFALGDVIVLVVMGMVCFVPFALFVRGVLSGGKPS